MDPNGDFPSPSGADDVKLGIDDAQVIAKTLPVAPVRSRAERIQRHASDAAESARGFVIERPMQAVLIAAAGGAALTAGLIVFMRNERQ